MFYCIYEKSLYVINKICLNQVKTTTRVRTNLSIAHCWRPYVDLKVYHMVNIMTFLSMKRSHSTIQHHHKNLTSRNWH